MILTDLNTPSGRLAGHQCRGAIDPKDQERYRFLRLVNGSVGSWRGRRINRNTSHRPRIPFPVRATSTNEPTDNTADLITYLDARRSTVPLIRPRPAAGAGPQGAFVWHDGHGVAPLHHRWREMVRRLL